MGGDDVVAGEEQYGKALVIFERFQKTPIDSLLNTRSRIGMKMTTKREKKEKESN
jgi:hypothetical protein